MGDPKHALAVEVHFRPLLVELGVLVPPPVWHSWSRTYQEMDPVWLVGLYVVATR